MANSPSAKKRIRQSEKRQARNRRRKVQVKEVLKSFDAALTSGDMNKAAEQLRAAEQRLDKVAAKGTIHKKTASRKISRLAKALHKAKTAKAQA